MRCPLTNEEQDECSRFSCLNNVRGKCEYQVCSHISALENGEDRTREVCRVYAISEEDLRSKISEVMMVVLVNSFFEFLFQKPILDCKQKEIDAMLSSESKYYEWRGKKTPSFNKVSECVKSLITKL